MTLGLALAYFGVVIGAVWLAFQLGRKAGARQRTQWPKPAPPPGANVCSKCGTYLWNDPRPCWYCAYLRAYGQPRWYGGPPKVR